MVRAAVCRVVAFGAFLALGAPATASAQTNVKVVAKEVVDDRISEGLVTGGLVLQLELEGDGLDAVQSARVRLKTAKADTGEDLLTKEEKAPDFTDRNVNAGTLQVVVKSPPRAARSVEVSGTVELFVPGRDASAVVKVPGALAKLDRPVVSKGLKSAKVELTLLSKAKYVEERKKSRLDEAKIAQIRAEGKARGVKDEEVEALVEMAKAFDEMGEGDLPEHGFYLKVPAASDERIQEVWLETAKGEKLETGGSSSRSDEAFVLKQVSLREAPPKDAVLVARLLTGKSIVPVPFEMKEVRLP